MGSFIKNIIGAEERIVLLARLHWIYLMTGLGWLALFTGCGVAIDYFLWHFWGATPPFADVPILGSHVSFLLALPGGAFICLLYVLKLWSTEIALTDMRLIYKTGLIFVEVEEVDLVEIRSEHVHHGLLGRFLGYGQLQLDSRFVGDIHLPAVKQPYRLIKAMHNARRKLHDPMSDESVSNVVHHDQGIRLVKS